jgi:outer membrane protein insertion porin family
LKEKAEDVNLFVEMEEKKPYYFHSGLGYQSDIGAYLNAKLGDRNFLGGNKNVWIGGAISQVGYRAEAWYSEPRFMGTHFSNNSGVYAEKKEEFNQNFGVKRYGASTVFSKKWTDHLTAGLAFKYENRKSYEIEGRETDEDDINSDEYRSRNILIFTPSVSYDTRDSSIMPKKGIYTMISTDFSQGIDNDLDSFINYKLDGRYYYTPKALPRLTLALLGRLGYIDPLGDVDDIPDDQLFYLGGIADVRGYEENMLLFDDNDDPVGGRTSVVTSLEARFDIGANFELTTFLDAGRITETEIPIDDDWRKSVGAGIRYITPIGPIGFLYGHKLDKTDKENSGRLHFSLGYTF